jgi:serine/threonine protein kinase
MTRVADMNNEFTNLHRQSSINFFSEEDFSYVGLLGIGVTSNIMLADLTVADANTEEKKQYALKIMSKSLILSHGRLRHTVDECKILSRLTHPFIVGFYGLYQTINDVIIVMEPLYMDDLWNILHGEDCAIYRSGNKGLSIEATRFYAASLIHTLDYIHSKGIAYRDLHPENILIDDMGYIRLVDFGVAKQIPYMTTDSKGNIRINVRSFTLCGAAGVKKRINNLFFADVLL